MGMSPSSMYSTGILGISHLAMTERYIRVLPTRIPPQAPRLRTRTQSSAQIKRTVTLTPSTDAAVFRSIRHLLISLSPICRLEVDPYLRVARLKGQGRTRGR